jgi:hypothetical protein
MLSSFLLAAVLTSHPLSLVPPKTEKSETSSDVPVFVEPLAFPRSAETYATVNTAKYHGFRIQYIEAAIGKGISVTSFESGDFIAQVGLEAGTWMTLGYVPDSFSFPLLTQDFLLSVPLTWRWNSLSGALKFNHISAHLGDGFDLLLEKTLTSAEKQQLAQAEQSGLDVQLVAPKAYSRDFFSLLLSHDSYLGKLGTRTYVHAGYAHKMIPDKLGRWYLGNGLEAQYTLSSFSPFYAQDVTWNQDTDSIDYSGQLGVMIEPADEDLFEARFAFTAFAGSDRRGQMIGNKLKQFGFGLFIR